MDKIIDVRQKVRESINLYDGGDGTVLNLDLIDVVTERGRAVAWVFAAVDFSHDSYPVCLDYGIADTASNSIRQAARKLRVWAARAEGHVWGDYGGPDTCPECGSHAVSCDDFTGHGGKVYLHCFCDECHANFVKAYEFVRDMDPEDVN